MQAVSKLSLQGFPGSQPVSMDRQNLGLLREKPYKVSEALMMKSFKYSYSNRNDLGVLESGWYSLHDVN